MKKPEPTLKAHHRGTEALREQFFAGPGDGGPAKARLKGGFCGDRIFLPKAKHFYPAAVSPILLL
jgi:hypothetical protein